MRSIVSATFLLTLVSLVGCWMDPYDLADELRTDPSSLSGSSATSSNDGGQDVSDGAWNDAATVEHCSYNQATRCLEGSTNVIGTLCRGERVYAGGCDRNTVGALGSCDLVDRKEFGYTLSRVAASPESVSEYEWLCGYYGGEFLKP